MRTLPLILILTSAAFAGDEPGVTLRLRAWSTTHDGSVTSTDDNIPGTEVEFDSDLDVESFEEHFAADIRVRLSPYSLLSVEGFATRLDGDEIVDAPIVFGGAQFLPTTRVKSEITLAAGRAAYEPELYFQPHRDWKIYVAGIVGVGVHYFSARLSAVNIATPFTEKEVSSLGFPFIGARVTARFTEWFEGEARVTGTSFSAIPDVRVTFIDIDVNATFNIYREFHVSVGWKYFRYDAEDERRSDREIEYEAVFRGPIVSFGYRY